MGLGLGLGTGTNNKSDFILTEPACIRSPSYAHLTFWFLAFFSKRTLIVHTRNASQGFSLHSSTPLSFSTTQSLTTTIVFFFTTRKREKKKERKDNRKQKQSNFKMKAAFVIFTALGSVAAINLDGIPECAVPCLQDAIPKVGCSLDDTGCQCSTTTQEKLAGIVAPCLIKKCSPSELNQAQEAAGAACAAYSASAAAPTTHPAATSKAAPTSAAYSAPADDTTVVVTSTAQVTATIVSTPAVVPTPPPHGNNGTASGTKGAGSTPSGTSSPPLTTNAAAVAGPAFGAVVAVFAAALAL
ncbi:hypothetical protein BGZ63DRAFT_143615 [Mariannaea sp. PMI_226]|nr:hypothetical protein BGZ63DRAFT_143615 [Mariannaea sp. PMI_226]